MAKGFLGTFHDRYDSLHAWQLSRAEYQKLEEKCRDLESIWTDLRKTSLSEEGFENVCDHLENAVLGFQAALKEIKTQLDTAMIEGVDA